MSKQKNWKVRSHSEPIADTGDYDGYWEIVNDKGDSFRTSEDYDDIEEDLQKIADPLNSFDGALSFETACEINLHCDNMQLKMEIDQLKQPKDSPYQGSAGTWVKASNGKPKVKGIYITRRPTLEGANWIYADVTYNPKYGDTYIDQWENFGLEWLDDSAASPAGDGWVSEKPDLQRECLFNTASWFKDHWEYGLWEIKKIDGGDGWYYGLCNNEGEEWGPIEDLKADKYLILPSPPKTSV